MNDHIFPNRVLIKYLIFVIIFLNFEVRKNLFIIIIYLYIVIIIIAHRMGLINFIVDKLDFNFESFVGYYNNIRLEL